MRDITIILLLAVFSISCQNNHISVDKYALTAADVYLSFPIDEETKLPTSFVDCFEENGMEYLTFPNRRYEILIYELKSGKLVKKIHFDKEGPNAIEGITGYLVTSFSHICIPALGDAIAITDSTGMIRRKIMYGRAENGDAVYCFPQTSIYRPMYLIGDSLYLPQILNRTLGNEFIRKSPVCAVVDTTSQVVNALPLKFNSNVATADVACTVGGLSYSYCYNERNFVFSFRESDSIIQVATYGKILNRYLAKSKYIDKAVVASDKNWDLANMLKLNCEIPTYGNLIYDKYRELYYRFVFPKTEVESGEDYMNIIHNGKKQFAIIILDKEMKIVGETLFPEYTYNSNIFFIGRDGLYLSVSHYKRSDFDENILRFQRIDVVKM